MQRDSARLAPCARILETGGDVVRGVIKHGEQGGYEVYISSCWGSKTYLGNLSTYQDAVFKLRANQIYKSQIVYIPKED
jgi:hypothetical protein